MTLDDIFPPSKTIASKPRRSDHELEEVAAEANWALQQLHDMAGREVRESARFRFPRGYLREIGRWRVALGFIHTALVRNSVADMLMMHDVQAWVLKRTDIAGHARDMQVKAAIGALGSIAEALLIDATSPPMGKRQKVTSRVKALEERRVLDVALAADLTWLWDVRNRQHIHALSAREFDVYTSTDHPRAEAAVARLIRALQARAGAPAA